MFVVALATVLFLLASSSIPGSETLSIPFRVAGLVVVLVPVLWRKRLAARASFPGPARAMLTVGIGYFVYLIGAEFAHGQIAGFFYGLVSFALVAALVVVLLGYYSVTQVSQGLVLALYAICIASLVGYYVAPAVTIEHDRLRGVMENANGLGYVAFALGVALLITRTRTWVIGVVVVSLCLLLSASRASLLALGVAVIALAVAGVRRARWCVLVGLVLGALMWIINPGFLANVALFRTTDTRSVGFDVMSQTLDTSFWTGVGQLPLDIQIAGSPFAAGIMGGFIGLAGLIVMYLGLIVNFSSSRPRGISLVLAAAVHSVFESWILSFSAPMLLVFFVSIVAAVKMDAEDRHVTGETGSAWRNPRNARGGDDRKRTMGLPADSSDRGGAYR
ncbi:hypothetical protein GCM10027064_13950 [Microbacterium petrolearium]